MSYFRAIDPFPLESAEQNKLHEFYGHLAAGRLVTTLCTGCKRWSWPPRGFCAECGSDQYDWVDLPQEGTIHAFTVQETGIPAGFEKPLILAMVKVADFRIFARIVEAEPTAVSLGKRVRFTPVKVAPDHAGGPRYLPAFRLAEG
ncbi:MAG: OB-fold domain-containing protein [Candidatus Rokubacteria bacterium]|nr:OB-fold domain-containing protein [Candidatus Rokubacteria bacterium]